MLRIVKRSDEDFVTLKHGTNVFQDALAEVKNGETRFHVKDPDGIIPDYDLEYIDNMMLFPEQVRGLIIKMSNGGRVYAEFLDYDLDDKDNLCLEFLDQFDRFEIEGLDEYSYGLALVVLKYTDFHIYSVDERIKWFIDDERIHIVDALPEEREKTTLRVTPSPFEMGYSKKDWSYLANIAAFQNVFFWQAFAEGKKGPFKYTEVVLTQITGIGGILSILSMVGNATAKRGLKTYLKPGCTRYSEKLLCRYFKISSKPEDATEDNTIVIGGMLPIFTTCWYASQFPTNFDESILSEEFAAEMREYAEAVIGGRKTLGVLARGTDYVTNNLGADRIHANVDQMIAVIHEWMDEGGYEKIFLATEDQDNYDRIRAEFPGKVIAVAQERHSVSEMKKKNSTLIYEFEKKINSGKAYDDALEDTTVNYFYALYILSKCDAYLCSGQCNGWDTVRSLNGGKFERERKLLVTFEGDPEIEKWKEVRPVTAGMFARGAYPTDKAFYMTYRFDLKEKVDPDVVRSAWEKTLKVYPYFSYAIGARAGKLVFMENDRPFVIKETSEVVEPFSRSGNFHTVTFCYLENVLWVYVDHVPTDGTGFRFVLETFFYNYYCELDSKDYPVPEGVLTEKDGVVDDTDAYRMVDAINPKTAMSKMMGGKNFNAPESVKDELFAEKEDCRGYCISIPSDELIRYAKTVKGSPMSVMAVFFAKAVESVHPENNLPISMMTPISVRNVMGNTYSPIHQVVHSIYNFTSDELKNSDDESLNTKYREFLKGFTSEQNIKMLCGVYRGICEGYEKAFAAGALDSIILEQRANLGGSFSVSYVGTLRTGEYGDRIRMTAFHAMQEKGIMLQVTEVGNAFYIDWYQGFAGDMYAKTMRDLMKSAGMNGATLERVE
jgi:hypothetical protein